MLRGTFGGTWELKSSKVLDENSGKLTNALKEHEDKDEIYVSFMELISLIIYEHILTFIRVRRISPSTLHADYLKEYQVVDQWNKSITYTKEVSNLSVS